MKKTLRILLAALLCFAMLSAFAGAEDVAGALDAFKDAPAADSWQYAGLASAVENNIMKGSGENLRPDDHITRAELTAMMVRVLGAQADKADISHLVDVAFDAWYVDYIKSGVATKIVNGSGNKMMPNDPVTREQAFAILARTFVLASDNHDTVHAFDDAHHVSDWAKDATAALIERQVVLGGASNNLRPKDNVTRAEYAAMLDRLVGEYAKPGKSYAGQVIKGNVVITDPNVDLTGAIIEGDVIIADSLGGKEVALKNTEVSGDLVVRAGTVVVSNDTAITNVVYGNPVHPAKVVGENGATAEKVVVTENATEVENEISAEKVEVSSSDANVTLGGDTEYKDVAIEGNNTEVKVDAGTKVENVVANGSSNTVSGSGKVENAVVNGEGTKVETPNTNVTDTTPVAPPSGGDEPAGDNAGANDTPNNATVPSGKDAKITSSYITYDGGTVLDAEVSGNTVEFDFTVLDVEVSELEDLYVAANVTSDCVHPLATFSTNVLNDIAAIVAEIPNKTNNNLVPIDPATAGDDLSLWNLSYIVIDAKEMYDLQDQNNDYLFRDLFTAKGIKIESYGADAIKSTFTGKIGNDTFNLVIITEIPRL